MILGEVSSAVEEAVETAFTWKGLADKFVRALWDGEWMDFFTYLRNIIHIPDWMFYGLLIIGFILIFVIGKTLIEKLTGKKKNSSGETSVNVEKNTPPAETPAETPSRPVSADHFPAKLPIPVDEQYFLFREKQVEELKNLLHEGKQPIISGIGGIGKTTLARKLFYEVEADYDCACWVEFSGDLNASLLSSFTLFREEKEEEQRLSLILDFFKDPRRKLLVVDNVDDPKDNSLLLRQLSGLSQVQVVLTSRMKELSPYTPYPLDYLTEEECVKLFDRYCKNRRSGEEETVKKLVRLVSCHTLALELLAKSVPKTGTLAEYYDHLVKEGFGFPKLDVKTDHQAQSQTVSEHLHKLYVMENRSGEQQRILRNLAFMPTMDIPPEVTDWLNCEENDLNHLAEDGWLTEHENCWYLHPIIKQTILLDKKEFPKETGREFVDNLTRHKILDENEPYSTILPKLELADGFLTEWREWNPEETELVARACNELGYHYNQRAMYRNAVDWNLIAVEIYEKVVPDSASLATSYNNLGSSYGDLGDHKKELDYLLKALEIRKKVLPPDHPDLADSYNNVGAAYFNMGDHKRSLDHLLKALEICEKVLPPDHPDLAASYNNVGLAYGKLGDHKRSLDYLLKALEICEKALPDNHPNLAASYNNVGATLYQLEKYPEAEEMLLKAVEIRKQRPECRRDLAGTYSWLSAVENALGNTSAVEEYRAKGKALLAELAKEEG